MITGLSPARIGESRIRYVHPALFRKDCACHFGSRRCRYLFGYFGKKSVILALTLFVATVKGETLTPDLLLYAPFDGHTDVVTSGGGLLPSEYRKVGRADGSTHNLVLGPRYEQGRFGQAIYLESGDYGNFKRGTRNLLASDDLRYANNLRMVGRLDARSYVARFQPSGAAAVTDVAKLPVPIRVVGSLYLRSPDHAKVDMQIHDRTNQVAQSTLLQLTDEWQRYHVVLFTNERSGTYEGKKLTTPAEIVVRVVAKEKGTVHLSRPMIEQAGIHYSNRQTPSSWVPPGLKRGSEVLNLPVTPRTFRVEEGTISFWMNASPGKLVRCFFAFGHGWDTPIGIREYPPGRLDFNFFGGRVFGKAPSQGTWHHMAARWKWPKAELFIDGKQVLSTSAKNPAEIPDVFRRHAFLMPGNAESGMGGGSKTHIDGLIDEFCVFGRALNDEALKSLSKSLEPILKLEGIYPRLDSPCRAYGREMDVAEIPFSLVNFSEQVPRREIPARTTFRSPSSEPPSHSATVTVRCESQSTEWDLKWYRQRGLLWPLIVHRTSLPWMSPELYGTSLEDFSDEDRNRRRGILVESRPKSVRFLFPCGRLVPGNYPVTVDIRGDTIRQAVFDLKVTPYRDRERLPVHAWGTGGDSPATLQTLKELGVNVAGTGVSPRALDWASDLGMYGADRMLVHGHRKAEGMLERIVTVGGKDGGIRPSGNAAILSAKHQASDYAQRIAHLPALKYVIINTEWTPPMDFSEQTREQVKAKFGIDIQRWSTSPEKAWSHLHPHNRLNPTLIGDDWMPKNGIVSPNDPFYKFHLWHHTGGGNEVGINMICARTLHELRRDVVRIVEPILRAPPLMRYGNLIEGLMPPRSLFRRLFWSVSYVPADAVEVAQEWFYYVDPRIAVQVQERLACISRYRLHGPSGMPQFLFKKGWAAPYAVTPPPDMLREVLWLCASRPLKQMTFWGWHRVLERKKKMMLPGEAAKLFDGLSFDEAKKKAQELGVDGDGLFVPETKEEFRRFAREVLQPFGPLMRWWYNAPRKIAVVVSFAAQLYNNIRWPNTNLGWLGNALNESGVPYDILYDDSFLEDSRALKKYRVVLLPHHVVALPEETVRQLIRFSKSGGLVIADTDCRVKGIPKMQVFEKEDAAQAVESVIAHAALPVQCDTPEIFWNMLELDDTTFLVAVNDKRISGPLLGQWKIVRETGVAQHARFRVRSNIKGTLYDLTASSPIQTEKKKGWREFSLELGPTEGRILAFLPAEPNKLTLRLNQTRIKRGDPLHIEVRLKTGLLKTSGSIPVNIKITEPDGSVHDRSGWTCLRKGRFRASKSRWYGLGQREEILIPVNAQPGEWSVKVQERASNRTATATFQVKP